LCGSAGSFDPQTVQVDLASCIAGDKEAWDAFVRRHAGVVWAAVRRTLRGSSSVEAADLVQEVFVRLLHDQCRLLRSFDPCRASLPTWLALVARSVTIDHLRRRALPMVRAGVDSLDRPDTGPSRADSAEPLPLHVLTARQRLVLAMLFERGMSVAQTAKAMGVDEQTIRSSKHKALSRLREHLGVAGGPPRVVQNPGGGDALGGETV
jgi:RNA polymerase sigma-70 factor (ECF subfamily)